MTPWQWRHQTWQGAKWHLRSGLHGLTVWCTSLASYGSSLVCLIHFSCRQALRNLQARTSAWHRLALQP